MPRLLWTQKEDIGPSPRSASRMAYDRARRRSVLVEGFAHVANEPWRGLAFPVDTWEWDGTAWMQTADTGPEARRWHGFAYDARRERVVLFGGSSPSDLLGDTWEWDGEYWTQMADSGPSPRCGAAMVFDEARGRVVLCGGFGQDPQGGYSAWADTWEWDGNAWSQQDDVGPAARSSHAMAYDIVRSVTVLFGGNVLPAGIHGPVVTVRDTWERGAAGWVQRSDMGPPALQSHAMAYNGRGVMLFGGASSPNSTAQLSKATWEWDGVHWIQRQDMGPAARSDLAMTYDPDRDRIVLFGGQVQQEFLGDTWELLDNQPRA
jgi:galactose oxidase-like protein